MYMPMYKAYPQVHIIKYFPFILTKKKKCFFNRTEREKKILKLNSIQFIYLTGWISIFS